MNFRKLITYLTMGTAAAMPIATAQNPTILQGNYITNVFGNSNFVLNPNAQTNVANVTVSNATVTRSTTTPLVATSEFTITTSTATGYADWSLRAFDQGMKGQNCEARFTYRGFSVGTTTAQILQGSNTVAQLTLTASTDPRIASINFPCGDLSAATTLRVQQATAALTGTNELSGLYLGLATNQANVAQAEFVGSLNWPVQTAAASTSSSTYVAIGNIGSTNPTAVGNVTFSAQAPKITINSLKPGNYQISFNGFFGCFSSGQDAHCNFRLTDGTTEYGSSIAVRGFGAVSSGAQGNWVPVLTYYFQYTGATTSKTFQLEARSITTGTTVEVGQGTTQGFQVSAHRFPTSSELVVTPERQNVFGGVKWSGNIDISTISSVTNAIINTTNFGTPTPFGKASIASSSCGLSANDVGVCFDNVPPGTYEITTSFEQGSVYSFGTPGATACSARIHVSGTSFSDTAVASAFTEVGASGQTDWVTLSSGVVTISSFQPKLSLVLKQSKSGNNGRCLIRSSANGTTYPAIPTITMKPLDQPSNSALYVQGPVLGAQTGATIAAGYVGEKVTWASAPSDYALTTTEADWTNASITLNPGVWYISAQISMLATTGATAGNDVECRVKLTDSANNVVNNQWRTKRVKTPAAAAALNTDIMSFSTTVSISSQTTYKIRFQRQDNNGTNGCTAYYQAANYSDFYAIRLN